MGLRWWRGMLLVLPLAVAGGCERAEEPQETEALGETGEQDGLLGEREFDQPPQLDGEPVGETNEVGSGAFDEGASERTGFGSEEGPHRGAGEQGSGARMGTSEQGGAAPGGELD